MDMKIVQIDMKIEPINFVHDHFFQQISIGYVAAELVPLAASLGPQPVLAEALGPEMSSTYPNPIH